jgi:hypothetical protein
MDSSNCCGNCSFLEIQQISLYISARNLLPSAAIWSVPGYFYLLSFSVAILASKERIQVPVA